MVERDYIMRMLQEFFESIAKVVRRDLPDTEPDFSETQRRFDDMYNQFFRRPAGYFYGIGKEDILGELEDEGLSEGNMFAKIQMLSELLYQDALIKNDQNERLSLLEKSLYLFEYLDQNSRTYSWDRCQRIADIRKALVEANTLY